MWWRVQLVRLVGDPIGIDNVAYNINPIREPITIDIKPGSDPNSIMNRPGIPGDSIS